MRNGRSRSSKVVDFSTNRIIESANATSCERSIATLVLSCTISKTRWLIGGKTWPWMAILRSIFTFHFSLLRRKIRTAFQQLGYRRAIYRVFLLLARYVPNVAKRSVWEQRIIEDRPTSHFGKLRTAISRQRVIRSTSCLVLVGFSRSADRMNLLPAGRHLGKFQLAISLERVVRSTSCLILR